jgi:hypothetical protein
MLAFVLPAAVWGQEAASGFELRTTLTGQGVYSQELSSPPRDGSAEDAGVRGVFYPTWKLNENWSVSGAVQVASRPFFDDQFKTQGRGVKTDVLRAHLTYSKFWNKKSVVIRAGILSTAFGSFLLRYDDAVNPLIDVPEAYGYYYADVTTLGLAAVEADATWGRFDGRAQFANSSPANRRSIFDSEQYGNWAGGVGYTIRQGFRVGASTYRGPYLDRKYRYYFRGEAPPRQLPATAIGLDAEWGGGPWNVRGEQQWFRMTYQLIPTFTQRAGYVEARRVLTPRWYAAARAGYVRSSAAPGYQTYEAAIGFRPNTIQLIKMGYTIQQGSAIPGARDNVFAVQFITSFRPVSIARDSGAGDPGAAARAAAN